MESRADPTIAGRVPAKSWYVLAVFCLLYVVSLIDRQLMALALPEIKRDLGLSDFQSSILAGPAFMVTYILFGLPFGAFADRSSRRVVAWVGVTFWSVATCFCGLAQGYMALMIARAGVGAGEASLAPTANSTISDTFPRTRLTLATSIYAASAMLGVSLSFILGGQLLQLGLAWGDHSWPLVGTLTNWQFAFLVMGLVGFPAAFLAFTYAEPPRRHRSARPTSFAAVLRFIGGRRPLFVRLFGGFAFASLLTASVHVWVPTYMGRQFNLGPAEIGLIVGAVSLGAGAVSHLISGFVLDWLIARGVKDAHFRIYVWCALVAGPVGVLTFHTNSLPLFIAGLTLVTFLVGAFLGYAYAVVQLVSPNEYRGKMASLLIMVTTGMGNILGPVLVALLTDYVFQDESRLGWSISLAVGLCAFCGAWLFGTGCKYLRVAMDEAEAWR